MIALGPSVLLLVKSQVISVSIENRRQTNSSSYRRRYEGITLGTDNSPNCDNTNLILGSIDAVTKSASIIEARFLKIAFVVE
jgi:hypothetical protein